MQTRVLFVDDEKNVLDGLQRLLRGQRQQWDMAFVTSGEEALKLLAQEHFSVIVSDMRMPGMDGGRLLSEVRRLYPEIVRILLSGQSDRGLLLRSVGLAHQFLTKPCDPELLKTTIAQACRLREVLHQNALRRLVARIDVLPSLPGPYLELLAELRSPSASVDRVGRIIARDMGMTVKILQLVNSAFFGLRRHVTDPATAASLLGLDTIKALVLSVQLFRQLDTGAAKSFPVEKLWSHSVNVGAFAQAIARAEKQTEAFAGDALMAGLLHDIGRLVMVTRFNAEWRAAVPEEPAAYNGCEVEKRAFGATHAEVGAYLLGLWGMADPIVEAAAFHHEPQRMQAAFFTVLTAVCAANLIDYEIVPEHARAADASVTLAVFDGTPYAARVAHWREICKTLEEENLRCAKKSC